jgi:hypothetical protein
VIALVEIIIGTIEIDIPSTGLGYMLGGSYYRYRSFGLETSWGKYGRIVAIALVFLPNDAGHAKLSIVCWITVSYFTTDRQETRNEQGEPK